ncbi:hypothetical protein Pchl3084_2931 [Pseudomonas chlororaphis subsp. aureofaciens 30-84]|nr:hypothetical protein Pchl3084_2931 [Pseudomonas chlororaphis subsp. aureofaciens 30-84]
MFLKQGEEFLPFHRSIQEFLAGRYLARRVTGAFGEVRLHICTAGLVTPELVLLVQDLLHLRQ